MFKIDMIALGHEAMQSGMAFGIDAGIRDGLAELSRQLTAAGAPPGDLETQLCALLARPAPIEPGQDMVEALARVAYSVEDRANWRHPIAFDQLLPEAKDEYMRALRAQRAVLSALAGMGVEALPRHELSALAWTKADRGVVSVCDALLDLVLARVTPMLAAKDEAIRFAQTDAALVKAELQRAIGAHAAKDARIRELEADFKETNLSIQGSAEMFGIDPDEHPADIVRALDKRINELEAERDEACALAKQLRAAEEEREAELETLRARAEACSAALDGLGLSINAMAKEVGATIDASHPVGTLLAIKSRVTAMYTRAELAEKRLAAVLALTPLDIQRAWFASRAEVLFHDAYAERVTALIRSRAAESAHRPNCNRQHEPGAACDLAPPKAEVCGAQAPALPDGMPFAGPCIHPKGHTYEHSDATPRRWRDTDGGAALCLCPASSEYDPPCPRHGVLGVGVTGAR